VPLEGCSAGRTISKTGPSGWETLHGQRVARKLPKVEVEKGDEQKTRSSFRAKPDQEPGEHIMTRTPTQHTVLTTRKRKKAPAATGTVAAHAKDSDGEHHAVAIWDLHVYIAPDGDGWFAQGLEIDYGVQGDSVEEAKRNFETGLERTIDVHLKVDGDINNLLVFAPQEIIQEALRNRLNGSIKTYWQVSLHDIGSKTSSLPFDGISYLIAEAA
jgi:hypothetical protein